jgi:hypothetical protein
VRKQTNAMHAILHERLCARHASTIGGALLRKEEATGTSIASSVSFCFCGTHHFRRCSLRVHDG